MRDRAVYSSLVRRARLSHRTPPPPQRHAARRGANTDAALSNYGRGRPQRRDGWVVASGRRVARQTRLGPSLESRLARALGRGRAHVAAYSPRQRRRTLGIRMTSSRRRLSTFSFAVRLRAQNARSGRRLASRRSRAPHSRASASSCSRDSLFENGRRRYFLANLYFFVVSSRRPMFIAYAANRPSTVVLRV